MKKGKGSGSLLLKIRTLYRNMRKKLPVITFLLTVALAALLAFPSVLLARSGALRLVDYSLEDGLFQHASTDEGEVIIIGIRESDSSLIKEYGSNENFLAKLIEVLNADPEKAPAVIGLCMTLSESGDDYDQLIEALSASDNVVLSSKGLLSGELYVADNGLASDENDRFAMKLLTPDSRISGLAPVGHINVIPDSDGYIRHYYWDMELEDGTRVPSFAEACYQIYCEKKGISDPYTPPTSGALVSPENSVRNQEAESGSDLVRRDDGFTFIRYSLSAGEMEEISASDVLSGNVSADLFKGKAVMVGSMESSLTDSYLTAVSRDVRMPLTEFQGGMLYNLIHNTGMQDGEMTLQLIVLSVLLIIEIMLMIMAPLSIVLIFTIACVVLAFVGAAIAWATGVAYHPGFELLYMTITAFIGVFFRFQASVRTQNITKELFSRYVDSDILDQAMTIEAVNPDGKDWRTDKAAVLFADLRSFTTLSEKIEPDELLQLLNKYLSMADECIHRYGGRLDKFIGDCVMATWSLSEAMEGKGANVDERAVEEDILYRACCAALDIVHECGPLNERLEAEHNKSLRFGIGIHYGEVVSGNVGSEKHRNRTVIGDTVNVASRLESIAPSGSVYITEQVMEPLKGKAHYVQADSKLHLKGREKTVSVYALQSLAGLNRPPLVYDMTTGESFTPDYIRPKDNYVLYILGCRGSRPVEGTRYAEFGGQTSCYIVKTGKHALVVDCGSGLYDAAPYLADCEKIDVVLTHVHYDHIIGILCWGVFPNTADLTIYGSFEKWFGRKSFEDFYAAPFWPVQPRFGNLVETPKRGTPVRLGDGFFVSFFNSPHPDDTCIVKVNAGDSSICFMADCEHATGMPFDVIEGSDILIYDGMFKDEEYPKYAGFGHSTWQEGCRLAERAHVGRLIITHHDPKNSDKELMSRETEAKKMFANTSFARAGDVIRLGGKKMD